MLIGMLIYKYKYLKVSNEQEPYINERAPT